MATETEDGRQLASMWVRLTPDEAETLETLAFSIADRRGSDPPSVVRIALQIGLTALGLADGMPLIDEDTAVTDSLEGREPRER